MLNIIFTVYDPLPFGQIIWVVSLVLIFSFILSFIFRGKEKIDKGFVFTYHKLSYRRKFIRDIWMMPISFAVLFIAFRIANIDPVTEIIVYVVVIIIVSIQIIYNYFMWKKHEENG
jgi:hypothetical protein